ncbi:acetylornithine aminotransferase, partial [Streptomyces platensis subsp. clarensis]|nr:acetylornithine aminotransferase [Streptomyces platensis subsp. clarensis]
LTGRWQGAMMDNFGTPRVPLVRGEGTTVWDADGKEYLDFLGGIAVNALGHAHPAVVRAVSDQVATLGHVSNFFVAEPTVALAERLLALAGRPGRVYFSNSGAEANEAAFKIGRLTGRTHMVSTAGGFHGRTMGALALTGQPAKQAPFAPLPGDVDHEIQTGIGRTGHWLESRAQGVEADIITLAKGLGGGLPIGATLAFGPAADLLTPGSHGSTFSGNPVVCAGALAVLDTIEADGILENVKRVGERLRTGTEALGHPLVSQVRGAGLLLGIVLTESLAPQVQQAAQDAGLLVNAVAPDVIRLAPPLIVSDDEAEEFLRKLPAVLNTVRQRADGERRAGD